MNALPEDRTLLKLRDLELKLCQKVGPDAVHLLEDTIWGTPGALQYKHRDTAQKIPQLHSPWFLVLEKAEKTLGLLCLDQRKNPIAETFYIRYFAFSEGIRKKTTHSKQEDAPSSKGQGIFKRFSSSFFEDPKAILEAAGTPKAAFFAYVELENDRSLGIVNQMGFERVGEMSTTVFSRLFPKKQAAVRRSLESERAVLAATVGQFYQHHALFNMQGIFRDGNFFVLEENGVIVAGLQAHLVHWHIVTIPGFSGKIIRQMLPYIPFLKRLMNPDKFEFAAFEGIFYLPGHEKSLAKLFEGVLAMTNHHTALFWHDPQDPLFVTIRNEVRLGLLQKLKNDVPVSVVSRTYGLNDAEKQALFRRPFYISAFDTT